VRSDVIVAKMSLVSLSELIDSVMGTVSSSMLCDDMGRPIVSSGKDSGQMYANTVSYNAMSVPFYEMLRLDSSENWHLKIMRDALGADGAGYRWRDLTWARHVEVAPPSEIIIDKAGLKNYFTLDIAAGAPVLSARAAQFIHPLAGGEINLIPARVKDESAEYFVMSILSRVKCVNETKTQYVEKWTKDSYRPDRAGEYKMLWGIVIDPKPAMEHNLFRLWGSSQHVIVSHAIKKMFEQEGLTGARFCDVCTPKPDRDD